MLTRLRPVLAALSIGSLLTLAACGGSSDSDAGESASAAPATTAAPEPPDTWPVTGLPVAAGESSALTHPAFIVKVPETSETKPQWGFDKADMVVQELVEEGVTRNAVMFYSQLPERISSLRSGRHTDVGIILPLGGQIVMSGAATEGYAEMDKYGIVHWSYDGAGYGSYNWGSTCDNIYIWRCGTDGTHNQLHSVQANLQAIAEDFTTIPATRPNDYFDFADLTVAADGTATEADFPGTPVASDFTVTYDNGTVAKWTYANGAYTKTNGYMAADEVFNPDTVVVIEGQVTDAPYVKPGGAKVPVVNFVGEGDAWIFHEGKLLEVTWHKAALDSQLSFADKATGARVGFPRGTVWMHLMGTEGEVAYTPAP